MPAIYSKSQMVGLYCCPAVRPACTPEHHQHTQQGPYPRYEQIRQRHPAGDTSGTHTTAAAGSPSTPLGRAVSSHKHVGGRAGRSTFCAPADGCGSSSCGSSSSREERHKLMHDVQRLTPTALLRLAALRSCIGIHMPNGQG
jgi:hypothetical protein